LFKAFNKGLVDSKMKQLIYEAKATSNSLELVVGKRGDELVIKWFKGMEVQMGETSLRLTVAEKEPKGIDQISYPVAFPVLSCRIGLIII
jgi:hypothetical protein